MQNTGTLFRTSKTYNVTFNTTYQLAGVAEYNCQFFFDWSQLEENEYLVEISVNSGAFDTSTTVSLPLIRTTIFGSSCQTMTTNNATIFPNANQFLGGMFQSFGYSTEGRQTCYYNQNCPTYISSRPQNNTFWIDLMRNDAVNSFFTDSNNFNEFDYLLTFTPLTEKLKCYGIRTITKVPQSILIISGNTSTGDVSNYCTFNLDLGRIKEGKYNMYTTFYTETVRLGNGNIYPLVKSNIFELNNNYITSGVGACSYSNVICLPITYTISSTVNFLYSNYYNGSPIAVNPKSGNSSFYVKLENAETGALWLDGNGLSPAWWMTLFLLPIE